MLANDKRTQLDNIVSQMVANKETDNAIQFVVNDFKNKYSVEEPKESFLEKTSSVLDMIFGGGKVGEAIGTVIAKTKAKPEEKEFITPMPPIGKIAGSALQSAALFAPIGGIAKGITAGVRGLGMVKGASALGKIGAGALTGEVFDVALNLQQGKIGREALTPGLATIIGGGIPAIGVTKNVMVRFGEKQAPRVINSLIKPLAKDFSYGKNPGRAVAEEGIVANNFDDLINQIRANRQKIGQSIGQLANKLSEQPLLNIESNLSPLNDALKIAAKQNNISVANRINNVKRAITEVLEPQLDEVGNLTIISKGSRDLNNLTFQQTRNILSDIGDMTQFTGSPSDDKLVNSALKQVYGKIKETTLKFANAINPEIAQEFSKLTEKYADLHSAEIAAKYRDKIIERQNLIGFSPTTVGLGSALITAVATGGATIPSVLVGVSGAVIDKLATTPGFKTRLAFILSKKTYQEVNFLFRKIPALAKMFSTEKGIFPGDIILGERGEVISRKISEFIQKPPKIGLTIEDISKKKIGDNLTTKFLKYVDEKLIKNPKVLLSKEEVLDFARRPELKKGEADLLNRLGNEVKETKIPAQEFADSIRRELLELKPITLKEGRSRSPDEFRIGQASFKNTSIDARQGTKTGKNYEEVVFESPITTNGSSHYPNSKNYFAHARGDEVIEGGKKIWREQEIQSDLLQKENLSKMVEESVSDVKVKYEGGDIWSVIDKKGNVLQEFGGKKPTGGRYGANEARKMAEKFVAENTKQGTQFDQLSPFTNDRFGERIMRERIKEKASKGYSKYRLPTGETIGKIEGFESRNWAYVTSRGGTDALTPQTAKRGLIINQGDATGNFAESRDWVLTDVLADGRIKAVDDLAVQNNEPAYRYLQKIDKLDDGRFPQLSELKAVLSDKEFDGLLDVLKKENLSETFDFTGKSNPQYRRYQDWGKFLKNKYEGREVIDPQGNSWVEIDLKKEYTRFPIEAFGLAPFIGFEQEKK